jgi:hypothetical protein
MSEVEWRLSGDPAALLWHLHLRASTRKFHLFACAYVRRAWHLLDERGRALVAVVERYADGLVPPAAVDTAFTEGRSDAASQAVRALGGIGHNPWRGALAAAEWAARALAEAAGHIPREREAQTELIREVFGDPFRRVEREHRWLVFQNRLVLKLALAAYRDRSFDTLPILADALEDAGCTEQALLDHLRSPGPHVLGCWALDVILGKI